MIKPHLSHLFTCYFADGTCIRQTPDDVSATNPTKSAFFDVQQRIDDAVLFILTGPDQKQYSVDLRTGLFSVDGIVFRCCDPSVPDLSEPKYRLIYFRRVTLDFDAAMVNVRQRVQYFIGWQATAQGKNHQQTIVIEGAQAH